MRMMPQDLVHKAETVMSGKIARFGLAIVAVLALVFAYDLRQARNLSTQEAMDSAQLARNVSEGRGYTTQFIRPLSMFLIKRENRENIAGLSQEQRADLCRVKSNHPDIANAPGYPLLLAGWMKVAPFQFKITQKDGAQFARHQPDFLITALNQLLFAGCALLVFHLGRKMFDPAVGWISLILFFGCEVLWRFSASGLSTMLLLLVFLLAVRALLAFDNAVADANARPGRVLGFALLTGTLLGAAMLTRYSSGALIVPAVAYVLLFAGRWKWPATAVLVLGFAVMVAPWILRNLNLCGMPFGTATYAPLENTLFSQQHRLERSFDPNFTQLPVITIWWKFFTNLRLIATQELPKLGGSWVLGFFLAGLMVSFRQPGLNRMRWFALGSLLVLMPTQAIIRTALSDDSPEINSENLLVLLIPLVVIYGVSFFLALLHQVPVASRLGLTRVWLRRAIIIAFCLVCTLPLAASFLPGRTISLTYPAATAFPPYYPPDIQKVSGWMNRDEFVMSDVPWAVAWYGDRQSVWLTLDARGQFYKLTDYIKSVRALYLSPEFLDSHYYSQWVVDRHGDGTWGSLVIQTTTAQMVPEGFPLVKAYRLNGQLFLTDWERWLKPEAPAVQR
jgi:4-amino-4-deoxy-L-arabinose transferase-like glycosyltransferase